MLWFQKHRPQIPSDYVWTNADLRERLDRWIEDPESLLNLILTGPPGTGKTSLALLIRDCLHIEPGNFRFMNCSKDNGIDAVRSIDEFAQSGWGGLKLIVLDEAERLTPDAQEGLRGTMNGMPWVRFIFTCNDAQRLLEPLRSRCRTFEIAALPVDEFGERLAAIAESEGIGLTDDNCAAIADIAQAYHPDMRRAINVLQDSHRNGQIVMGQTSEPIESNWVEGLRRVVQGSSVDQVRQICTQIRRDEMASVYDWLWQNSKLFGSAEGSAILLIAEYLYRGQTVGWAEINLAALILQLQELWSD